MLKELVLIFLLSFSLLSCSKNKKVEYEAQNEINPYQVYQEGFEAFERGDYFYANKKFSEAELNFDVVEFAAKSAIMSSYSLFGINFYEASLENLERFLKKYPADNNVIYAHYLIAMIHYEQISDEKKDLQSILNAKENFNIVVNKFPITEYASDSKFKIDLINDILASKEMYIGRYYFDQKKWIPAINRFRTVVDDYDTTIYVEEALHRLVEVHYTIGLNKEAEKYAQILGYNYKSSKWYEKSYAVFNKDYEKKRIKTEKKKKSFLNKAKSLFALDE